MSVSGAHYRSATPTSFAHDPNVLLHLRQVRTRPTSVHADIDSIHVYFWWLADVSNARFIPGMVVAALAAVVTVASSEVGSPPRGYLTTTSMDSSVKKDPFSVITPRAGDVMSSITVLHFPDSSGIR